LNTPKTVEKGISEIVGALTDPILVFPGGWGDSLPDWLKTSITLERLVMNMRVLKGELPTGTDAEACAYLNTASLTQPMDHDWTQIYLYIAGKTYTRWKKTEMPEDIRVESLNDEQMRDLNRLKAWLYQKRTTVREDRERAERRQKKEEETAKRKEAQPALFDF
jgi:CO dehydrogenase/acetyl-CoA synthase beta subunit